MSDGNIGAVFMKHNLKKIAIMAALCLTSLGLSGEGTLPFSLDHPLKVEGYPVLKVTEDHFIIEPGGLGAPPFLLCSTLELDSKKRRTAKRKPVSQSSYEVFAMCEQDQAGTIRAVEGAGKAYQLQGSFYQDPSGTVYLKGQIVALGDKRTVRRILLPMQGDE